MKNKKYLLTKIKVLLFLSHTIFFSPKITRPFIVQRIILQKNGKVIDLFSDLHLPNLKDSKRKQKDQNKIFKKMLKKISGTLFFEGYPEDQKNRFNNIQLEKSKELCAPAYLDILAQTFTNNKVKFIPSDPRYKINNLFLNMIRIAEIMTKDSIDELIEGTAKIKKISQNEISELNSITNRHQQLKEIFEIIKNHYTLVEKPYLDQLKTKINKIFYAYEDACEKFSKYLFEKINRCHNSKILVVAGHEHIEKLKKLLFKDNYKIKKNIFDIQTIKFVQNLEEELSGENLEVINDQLEKKLDLIKIPTEAFRPI